MINGVESVPAGAKTSDHPSMSLDKKTVAYHEAGHATMARLLGINIVSVTIIRDGTSLGHVKHGDLGEASVEHRVMFVLGGYAAQRIYLGTDDLEDCQGSLEDIASASSLVESVTEGGR
jgi:ATP-dependent Zn protease